MYFGHFRFRPINQTKLNILIYKYNIIIQLAITIVSKKEKTENR